VFNRVQKHTVETGDYDAEIKAVSLPSRRKAEELMRKPSELLDDPDQFFWKITTDEFGSKVRVEHQTFSRNQTVTITNIQGQSSDKVAEAVRLQLESNNLAEAALSVQRDSRPNKKDLFIAKVAFGSSREAQLAKMRLHPVCTLCAHVFADLCV